MNSFMTTTAYSYNFRRLRIIWMMFFQILCCPTYLALSLSWNRFGKVLYAFFSFVRFVVGLLLFPYFLMIFLISVLNAFDYLVFFVWVLFSAFFGYLLTVTPIISPSLFSFSFLIFCSPFLIQHFQMFFMNFAISTNLFFVCFSVFFMCCLLLFKMCKAPFLHIIRVFSPLFSQIHIQNIRISKLINFVGQKA